MVPKNDYPVDRLEKTVSSLPREGREGFKREGWGSREHIEQVLRA